MCRAQQRFRIQRRFLLWFFYSFCTLHCTRNIQSRRSQASNCNRFQQNQRRSRYCWSNVCNIQLLEDNQPLAQQIVFHCLGIEHSKRSSFGWRIIQNGAKEVGSAFLHTRKLANQLMRPEMEAASPTFYSDFATKSTHCPCWWWSWKICSILKLRWKCGWSRMLSSLWY